MLPTVKIENAEHRLSFEIGDDPAQAGRFRASAATSRWCAFGRPPENAPAQDQGRYSASLHHLW